MSIIVCPECGKKISSFAEECVGCGCPMLTIREILNKRSLEDNYPSTELEPSVNRMEVAGSLPVQSNHIAIVPSKVDVELEKRHEKFAAIRKKKADEEQHIQDIKEIKEKEAQESFARFMQNKDAMIAEYNRTHPEFAPKESSDKPRDGDAFKPTQSPEDIHKRYDYPEHRYGWVNLASLRKGK